MMITTTERSARDALARISGHLAALEDGSLRPDELPEKVAEEVYAALPHLRKGAVR